MEQPPNSGVRRIFHKSWFGQDKFILVQTERIHYVESGHGEPVILLPGSYNSHRIWHRLTPLLAADYLTLEPEFQSQIEPPEKQTELIALMIQQIGFHKVNLIGGPSGGRLLFDLAVRYPDVVSKIVSLQGGILPSSTESKSSPKRWFRLNSNTKSSDLIEKRAKSIQAPLLYLYGRKTGTNEALLTKNIEFLRDYLPDSWVVSLEDGIYDLSVRKPEEIAELILVFLHSDLSQKNPKSESVNIPNQVDKKPS